MESINIIGYIFKSKEEADNAINTIDIAANLPKGNNITTNWTSHSYANLNEPPFYYIRHDKVVEQALGLAEEFEVIFEEF